MFDELSDIFKTKDGYVRLHTNFPHHKQGILDILQCEPTKAAVAAALLKWSAEEFEAVAFQRHLCAAALRSFEVMDGTPHGIFQTNINPVTINKIGDAPKRVLNGADLTGDIMYALEGIRVLDLTRVLAGPVCGRTLAAHGADVLLVTSPHLPSQPFLDVETSRGKRTTQLDLNKPTDEETLRALMRDADVFLQSYRPGGLAARGFGPEDCAALRPGIVHASLTGFSPGGPWENVKTVGCCSDRIAPENERAWNCGICIVVRLAPADAWRVQRAGGRGIRARCPCKCWITPRGTSSHSASQPRSAKP